MSIELSSAALGLERRSIQKIAWGSLESAVPGRILGIRGRTSGLGGLGGLGEGM
jgi:hypothetical protein